jgi:hypothetical protein
MYVLVRKDLDAIYRMVQGSHALAQFFIDHTLAAHAWDNKTIVFLGVRNEDALKLVAFKLHSKKKEFAEFHEPDLRDQLTAIACYDDGKIFKDLSVVTV